MLGGKHSPGQTYFVITPFQLSFDIAASWPVFNAPVMSQP